MVQMVDDIIMMELSHINTAHPDFVGGGRGIYERVEPSCTLCGLTEPFPESTII